MQTLSCPLPADLDVLKNNGFRFSIAKLPQIRYFCQAAELPSLELHSVNVPTPLIDYPVPGEKPVFGNLKVSFLIDSSMTNYLALHAWIIGLGFPQKHEQYQSFLASFGTNLDRSPLAVSQSDATLEVLSGSNQVSRTFSFVGLHPTGIGPIQFVTDNTDVVYQSADATFDFAYYTPI